MDKNFTYRLYFSIFDFPFEILNISENKTFVKKIEDRYFGLKASSVKEINGVLRTLFRDFGLDSSIVSLGILDNNNKLRWCVWDDKTIKFPQVVRNAFIIRFCTNQNIDLSDLLMLTRMLSFNKVWNKKKFSLWEAQDYGSNIVNIAIEVSGTKKQEFWYSEDGIFYTVTERSLSDSERIRLLKKFSSDFLQSNSVKAHVAFLQQLYNFRSKRSRQLIQFYLELIKILSSPGALPISDEIGYITFVPTVGFKHEISSFIKINSIGGIVICSSGAKSKRNLFAFPVVSKIPFSGKLFITALLTDLLPRKFIRLKNLPIDNFASTLEKLEYPREPDIYTVAIEDWEADPPVEEIVPMPAAPEIILREE